MIVTPEFPEHRLQDPRRQAEWRVYQEIAGSQAPGRALYEMRAGLHAPQLDFGIWLQDVAHYGLQVKGGETATAGGEWRLHSANGPETIPSARTNLGAIFQTGLSCRNTRTGRHILESGKVAHHLFQAIRLFVQDVDLLAQTFLHDAGALNNPVGATANSL